MRLSQAASALFGGAVTTKALIEEEFFHYFGILSSAVAIPTPFLGLTVCDILTSTELIIVGSGWARKRWNLSVILIHG